MTGKSKFITKLIIFSLFFLAGIALIVTSSVIGIKKYKGTNFSHNLVIVEIETDEASLSGVVYHYVHINGSIKNCTDKDLGNAELIIGFEGVNNSSGETNAIYETTIMLEGINANSNISIEDKIIKIGNKDGFVPQSIKKIELVPLDGGSKENVKFIKEDDLMLMLFGAGLVLSLSCGTIVCGVISSYLSKSKKKESL